jgi:hypothetical protein
MNGVITIAGTEHLGMLRFAGESSTPWLNQFKVYFVPQKDFPGDLRPKKNVILEYKPVDIDGYSTVSKSQDTSRRGWVYVTEEIMLVKGLSKKNTKVFLRRVEKGAVTVYAFIPEPDDNSAAESDYAFKHSTTYYKKGDDALVSAVECDMANLLSECPDVVSKIKSGAYGYADLSERPKKKGLTKIMADHAGDNELEGKLNKSVFEYNKCVE